VLIPPDRGGDGGVAAALALGQAAGRLHLLYVAGNISSGGAQQRAEGRTGRQAPILPEDEYGEEMFAADLQRGRTRSSG
jgi:hypothetical protein